MGDDNFRPPPESTPLNRSPKYLSQVMNLVHICPWGVSGQMGEIQPKLNFLKIYTLFSGTHLQVRCVDGFSRMMAQTTRTRARMCLLWVSLTLLAI